MQGPTRGCRVASLMIMCSGNTHWSPHVFTMCSSCDTSTTIVCPTTSFSVWVTKMAFCNYACGRLAASLAQRGREGEFCAGRGVLLLVSCILYHVPLILYHISSLKVAPVIDDTTYCLYNMSKLTGWYMLYIMYPVLYHVFSVTRNPMAS